MITNSGIPERAKRAETALTDFFSAADELRHQKASEWGCDPDQIPVVLISRRMAMLHYAWTQRTTSRLFGGSDVLVSRAFDYEPTLVDAPRCLVLDDVIRTGTSLKKILQLFTGKAFGFAMARRKQTDAEQLDEKKIAVWDSDSDANELSFDLTEYLISTLTPSIGDFPISRLTDRFSTESQLWTAQHLPQLWTDDSVQHITYLPTAAVLKRMENRLGGDVVDAIEVAKVRVFRNSKRCRVVPVAVPAPCHSSKVSELVNRVRLGVDDVMPNDLKPHAEHQLAQMVLSVFLLVEFHQDMELGAPSAANFLDGSLLRSAFGDRSEAIAKAFDSLVENYLRRSTQQPEDPAVEHALTTYFVGDAVSSMAGGASTVGLLHRSLLYDAALVQQNSEGTDPMLEAVASLDLIRGLTSATQPNEDMGTDFAIYKTLTFAGLNKWLEHVSTTQRSLAVDLGCDLGVIVAETVEVDQGIPDIDEKIVCRRVRPGENQARADGEFLVLEEATEPPNSLFQSLPQPDKLVELVGNLGGKNLADAEYWVGHVIGSTMNKVQVSLQIEQTLQTRNTGLFEDTVVTAEPLASPLTASSEVLLARTVNKNGEEAEYLLTADSRILHLR